MFDRSRYPTNTICETTRILLERWGTKNAGQDDNSRRREGEREGDRERVCGCSCWPQFSACCSRSFFHLHRFRMAPQLNDEKVAQLREWFAQRTTPIVYVLTYVLLCQASLARLFVCSWRGSGCRIAKRCTCTRSRLSQTGAGC